MNTKLFFLLLCLLTTNHTSSVVIKGVVQTPLAIVKFASKKTVLSEDKTIKADLMVPDPVTDPGSQHVEKGPKEIEDGKNHNFHFSRLPVFRRRNLVVIAGKLILTILHLCVFVYCFMHVFH
ncbi:MAG: hypothetical protein EOO14_00990 [Chitinophagaceae bacterium]|nr:MAG: hypothetical protein EOO14_00990 [Chitinophagaceae bacterium]